MPHTPKTCPYCRATVAAPCERVRQASECHRVSFIRRVVYAEFADQVDHGALIETRTGFTRTDKPWMTEPSRAMLDLQEQEKHLTEPQQQEIKQWMDGRGRRESVFLASRSELAALGADGDEITSLQIVQWAAAHPDSALHWILDFGDGVTDEQRAAEFDRVIFDRLFPKAAARAKGRRRRARPQRMA